MCVCVCVEALLTLNNPEYEVYSVMPGSVSSLQTSSNGLMIPAY